MTTGFSVATGLATQILAIEQQLAAVPKRQDPVLQASLATVIGNYERALDSLPIEKLQALMDWLTEQETKSVDAVDSQAFAIAKIYWSKVRLDGLLGG
jgi:rubrerythrin